MEYSAYLLGFSIILLGLVLFNLERRVIRIENLPSVRDFLKQAKIKKRQKK